MKENETGHLEQKTPTGQQQEQQSNEPNRGSQWKEEDKLKPNVKDDEDETNSTDVVDELDEAPSMGLGNTNNQHQAQHLKTAYKDGTQHENHDANENDSDEKNKGGKDSSRMNEK